MENIIDKAKCKNCLKYENGFCKEKNIVVGEGENCSVWDENLVKTEGDPEKLNRVYYKIIEVLKNYCDLKPEYYPIISLWIIGTYTHNSFPTYPYLFFNAMRGSGKSRILNLISKLSYNGKLVSNMTESVLFRTAKGRTLCIDEFEEVGNKEKAALRELLNSAYKKGMSVERAIKVRGKDKEKYEVESFDVYCPIVMANINGVEDVLSDRCITIILEKSTNRQVTRLIELFDQDPLILDIKSDLVYDSVVYEGSGNINRWNTYIKNNVLLGETYTSYTTNNTYTNLHTYIKPVEKIDEDSLFFNKVLQTNLEGRNLELFFPLLFLAEKCKVLDEFIPIAEEMVKGKKQEDFVESRDVAFLHFLSERKSEGLFTPLRNLVREFSETEEQEDWVTAEWVGRALRRLGLIVQKKRVAAGMEVIINYDKAREKVIMFK
jgi:hypothetical protein